MIKCPCCGGNIEIDEPSFGNRLRMLRFAADQTQENVADGIRTSRGAIAALENNRRKPSLRTVNKLAQYFDVTISELVK